MKLAGLALLSLVLLPSRADANCQHYSFVNARWIPQSDTISVALTGTSLSTVQPDATWFVIDTATQTKTVLPSAGITYTYNTATIPVQGFVSFNQNLVKLTGGFFLFATKLKFADCPTAQDELGPTAVVTQRTKSPVFAYSPSTNRDDSDFYLAPTIDGANGTGASYTLDTKLQLRKALLAPSFGGNGPYRPAVSFIPGVDAKISSNPKEDGNSVLFQAPLEILTIVNPARYPELSKVIPSVVSQPGFVAESDKKFHDINAIFSDSEYIVLRTFGPDCLQFTPEPTIGFETGSNIKAQSAGTYPDATLRANFGMHLGINVFRPKKPKPMFYIESDYVRRLLLNPEPVYKTDSNGNYVLVSVSTHPRDHVTVKFSYDLTTYVALSVAYENGQLPPIFTKVSDKYTFGITFKGQLQNKPAKTN